MKGPMMNKTLGSYVISVSLKPRCYRNIRISCDATLAQLSVAILGAYEFENDHAYAFFMDNNAWSDVDSYYMESVGECDDDRFTCNVSLRQLSLNLGMKFLYIFDFGDEWRFQCEVMQIIDEISIAPAVVQKMGASPKQY
jgi:hypothetical protein